MNRKRIMRAFLEYASKQVPCPRCNGKKFVKGERRCIRCGGVGYVDAPFRAHK